MNELQELQSQHDLGRAKNSVQTFLIRKLLIPKIYLDVDWYGWPIDVLAIDRAGVGDVHAVRLVRWEAGHRDNNGHSSYLERLVPPEITKFVDFPGHFRYLAVVCSEPKKQRWIPGNGIKNQSLAADGVGRIGILYLNTTDEDAEVDVLLKPERYRSSKEIIQMADQYAATHTANWEIRE